MAAMFVLDCPHCQAANSAFTITWSHAHAASLWEVAALCGGCARAILAHLATPNGVGVSLPNINGNVSRVNLKVVASWPSRESTMAPPHTPDSVANRFSDGEFNFQNGRWNAAVGMYRATLDLATKALNAQGATFYLRLGCLRQQDKVTQDIRDWADHVRVEGNGALHDPEEFSKEDATALRFFTTMFLRYVFEMPGRVAEFRAQQPAG
jgi:hypothetical protein